MKKLLLLILIIGFTIETHAQNWNPNGDNTTTGEITAKNIRIKDGLHIAPGNMFPRWRSHSHIKDRIFIYSGSTRKGMFFSSYGQGADIRFQTGNTWSSKPSASLLLANNGNVGIGTISPQEKLHVNGNIKVGGYIQGNGRGNATRIKSSFGYIDIGAVNAGRAHFHTDRSHYYFDKSVITQGDGFYTNLNTLNLGIQKRAGSGFSYQNNLTLTTDNKVGIGTTTPDMKLTVNGNIHAKEVKVDLNVPAPDYVFKDDYELKSIEQVESFIKKNHHLPEIPSAKAFKQNGVMLSEMNMNLLKKVEELTLYIIQLNKKIKVLERKVKTDKSQ